METNKTALITIDFINDIVHPDGKIPSCAAMVAQGEVLDRTNRATAWARARGVPVVHVKVGFHPDYGAAASAELHEQAMAGTLARLASVIDSSTLPA